MAPGDPPAWERPENAESYRGDGSRAEQTAQRPLRLQDTPADRPRNPLRAILMPLGGPGHRRHHQPAPQPHRPDFVLGGQLPDEPEQFFQIGRAHV